MQYLRLKLCVVSVLVLSNGSGVCGVCGVCGVRGVRVSTVRL